MKKIDKAICSMYLKDIMLGTIYLGSNLNITEATFVDTMSIDRINNRLFYNKKWLKSLPLKYVTAAQEHEKSIEGVNETNIHR